MTITWGALISLAAFRISAAGSPVRVSTVTPSNSGPESLRQLSSRGDVHEAQRRLLDLGEHFGYWQGR
jgi:hypothetical protein